MEIKDIKTLKELKELENLNKELLSQAVELLKADSGALYYFDILAHGVLNRVYSINSGFITLIKRNNILSAFTLIRPQLDSFLRFAAGWLVENPHLFAKDIFSGKKVRDLTTKDGERMFDRYLVDHFSKEHNWIKNVYEDTSSYIHLSDKHLLANITKIDKQNYTSSFSMSDKHPHVQRRHIIEAIMCMGEITMLVIERVIGWRESKIKWPSQKNYEENS